MTFIKNFDLEGGDVSQWYTGPFDGLADALAYPANTSGRAFLLTSFGRSWASQVAAQNWQSRWPMNETTGTVAADTIGGRTGQIVGGITLNQVGGIPANNKAFAFNGSTGFIDLGSNGWNLSSGSWSFFALVKSNSMAAPQGLLGGPTGAVTITLKTDGFPCVGVAGKGDLASFGFPNVAMGAGTWFTVWISYNSVTNTFQALSFPWPDGSASTNRVNNAPASFPGFSGVVTPTAGVKSSQIGRKDTSVYFNGSMQEVLIKSARSSQAEHHTLRQDAALRTTSLPNIITPDAGASKVAMMGYDIHPPIPTSSPVGADRAEWQNAFDYGTYHLQTYFYSIAFCLDPAVDWTNWAGSTVTDRNHPGIGQWLSRNLNACSFSPCLKPSGWEGTAGMSLVAKAFAGNQEAGGTGPGPYYYLLCESPSWTTLTPAPHTSRAPQRWPQMIGPNTQQGISRPLTVGVWHELIVEIKHATDNPIGYYRAYHRVRGSGLPFVKTLETPANYSTVQWSSTQGQPPNAAGSNNHHTQGVYVYNLAHTIRIFLDQQTISTSLAEAQSVFAPETGVVNASGTMSIHGGGSIGAVGQGNYSASDAWGQAVLNLPNLATWYRLNDVP